MDDERTQQRGDRKPGRPRLSLVIYTGGQPMVAALLKNVPITVGRKGADVEILDTSLSRAHARFTWRDDGVWVEDLKSTNGTWVGDRQVHRALLSAGDTIRLGSVDAAINSIEPTRELLPVVSEEVFEAWLQNCFRPGHRSTLGVVLLRPLGAPQPLTSWLPSLRPQLRRASQLGLYGPGWLLIGFAGVDRGEVESVARRVVVSSALIGGMATIPHDARRPEEAIAIVRQRAEVASAESPLVVDFVDSDKPQGIIVRSEAMRSVFDLVGRVAPSRASVLIAGETGTGKELIARAIHAQSPRARNAFRAVNCGAIPTALQESMLFGHEQGAFTGAERRQPGVFEQAHGGTVFMDEVGELPPTTQAALLRVLETRRVMRVGGREEFEADVRVIAATHRDLEAMVNEGKFRGDLYYRLNGITVHVPPLRERRDEILPLANHFLNQRATSDPQAPHSAGISEAAAKLLGSYSWPGNVRELRNAVERAAIVATGVIRPEDLPAKVRGFREGLGDDSLSEGNQLPLKEQVKDYERQVILQALKACQFNQTRAAQLLQIPIRTLAHKIQVYDLKGQFPKKS
ncbi:MAG: sigma 54-interacting transcriptional regulator [Myxococcota bacterium]